MFIFSKGSFRNGGERPRVRVIWWPLLLSLTFSVVVTLLLNR